MNIVCPIDLSQVALASDGMAVCPTCRSLLLLQAVAFRLGCDHVPRPVRGSYRFMAREVPYEFCSAECRALAEAEYPAGMVRLS